MSKNNVSKQNKDVNGSFSAEQSHDPNVNPQNILADSEMAFDTDWALQFYLWAIATTPSNFWFAEKLTAYRNIDLGIIDPTEMKQFFDPDPSVSKDKKADIMRTDFVGCPFVYALNEIIQKNVEALPIEFRVQGTDKLSEDKKATIKLQAKTRRTLVNLVNLINSATNDAPVGYDDNVEGMIRGENGEDVDESISVIDSIRKEASEDFDFNALNEAGALKDGVEISHEQLNTYYFEDTNFKVNIAPRIISDYMKVNAYCYRHYTSAINGLPRVQYMDLQFLNTSYFTKMDASDMDFIYGTFTITWGEYMHMVGGKQTNEKNMLIYNANKQYLFPAASYPAWQSTYNQALWQTQIQLGYFELKKHVKDKVTGKYYNQWKKFYYLPLSDMKGDYILDLGDVQDQYRYGTNLEESCSSYVLYRNFWKQSFYDVQQPDYRRLNLWYNQLLNTFANFIPEGTAFVEETIRELANDMMAEEEEIMRAQGQIQQAFLCRKFSKKLSEIMFSRVAECSK